MNVIITSLAAVLGAALWLALLVASNFSAIAVDGGLLLAIVIIGFNDGGGTKRPRSGLHV